MNNEIIHFEEKLAKMRLEYKTSSPAMQKYLLVGAKLIKHKLELLRNAETKKNTISPPKLF
jgi:hypothetical protein